ncbi:MAG: hypothetical protein R2777_08915 [Chitinophagales bacterium]
MKKVFLISGLFLTILFSCSKEENSNNPTEDLRQENVMNPSVKSIEDDPTAELSLTQGLSELPDRFRIGVILHLWDRSGIRGRTSSFCRYAGFCGNQSQPYYGDFEAAESAGLLVGRDIVAFLSQDDYDNGYLELYFTSEVGNLSEEDIAFINPSKVEIVSTDKFFSEGVFQYESQLGEYGGYKIPIE